MLTECQDIWNEENHLAPRFLQSTILSQLLEGDPVMIETATGQDGAAMLVTTIPSPIAEGAADRAILHRRR